MNVFTVIGIVVISMVIATALIAWAVYRLSLAVTVNNAEIEYNQKKFRPAQTLGLKIATAGEKDEQFKDARQEAAKRAAALGRGANMRIGSLGHERLQTSSQNLADDAISAFKIAQQQGWQGLGQFEQYQAAASGAAAAPVAAAGPRVKRKLIPGEDYQVVEVTANMDGVARRQARIANAKAKSAAMKALKAAGADTVAAAAPAAAPVAAAPVAPAGPSAADMGIPEPTLIEITDDMDPAAKRQARIANSKAKSAYKKALKAAGIDPKAAAAAPAPAPAAAPPPPPPAPAAALPSDVPAPDLIEITDDMDPDAKRQARIANSKAKSAYKKALKAAGIDPKSVKI